MLRILDLLAPLRDARFVLPFVYVLIVIPTEPYLFFQTSCSNTAYLDVPGDLYTHSLISFRFILGNRPSAYQKVYSVDVIIFLIIRLYDFLSLFL